VQLNVAKKIIVPVKKLYFMKHNVRSAVQVGEDLFLVGFGNSRTQRMAETKAKPRYALLYPSSKLKSVLELKSPDKNTGSYCTSLVKATEFSQINFPYIFARQPFGIDIINLRAATVKTLLQSNDIKNSR
jgi:hypothetical protein